MVQEEIKMFKLYILSILFSFGCEYIAKLYLENFIYEHGIKSKIDKHKAKSDKKMLKVLKITPLLNILYGVMSFAIASGKLDDKILKNYIKETK